MEDKVILPTSDNIPIKTFNHHAGFLSILFTVKDFYKYFYSDFINIWLKPNPSACGFLLERWYTNPMFFDCFIIKADRSSVITDCMQADSESETFQFLNQDNCIENIKTMLKAGFYISGRINEFYVPDRVVTGKSRFRHDFYLTGYDDFSRTFLLGGYTVNKKYEIVNINYSDFVAGLSDLLGSYNVMNFCRLKKSYDFDIDVLKITALLKDYLGAKMSQMASTGIFKANTSNFAFGIGVYDGLLISIEKESRGLDIRVFKMLLEHKNCMLERFKVLLEKNIHISENLTQKYSVLRNNHQNLVLLAIKYNLSKDKALLNRICEKIKILKEEEYFILNQVLTQISNQI